MSSAKKCDCPLCKQSFVPDDGVSPDEHLARGVLRAFAQIQIKSETDECAVSHLPCPRCGKGQMQPKLTSNTLCQHEHVYICEMCGTDEAALADSGEVLPLPDFWIVREILGRTMRARVS